MQRYAQTWSGDNYTCWDTLEYNNNMALGLSMSGMYNIGHDTGGFSGPPPGPELLARWFFIGAFTPRFGVNSWKPDGTITELAGYASLRPEVRYGVASRVDMLLTDAARSDCYVEVKNVHLSRDPGLAEFPDSVTARGSKHLEALAAMVKQGARAVMLFVVQRSDCKAFRPAADLDPAYAAGLIRAMAAGVETLCYDCDVTTEEVTLRRPLPLILNQPD